MISGWPRTSERVRGRYLSVSFEEFSPDRSKAGISGGGWNSTMIQFGGDRCVEFGFWVAVCQH